MKDPMNYLPWVAFALIISPFDLGISHPIIGFSSAIVLLVWFLWTVYEQTKFNNQALRRFKNDKEV